MALQVWLPLNGNLNNQGIDNTTVTNNGAVVDNNGKIGKCYNFDGTYISFNRPLPNPCSTFTVCGWVKLSTGYAANNGLHLISFETSYGRICISKDGQAVRVLLNYNGTTSATGSTATASSISANVWNHYAVTFDSGKINIYINGQLDNSYTVNISQVSITSSILKVGTYGGESSKGYVNDFRLYDRALAPKEIEILSRGLVAHYPLNGGGRGGDNLLPNQSAYHSLDTALVKTSASKDGWAWVGNSHFIVEPSTTYTISVDCDGNIASGHNTGGTNPSTRAFTMWLYLCNSDTTKDYNNGGYDAAVCLTSINYNFRQIGNKYIWQYTTTSTQTHMSLRTNTYSNGTDPVTVKFWQMKVEKGNIATPWLPNVNDSLYASAGYNSTTEYDVSGYGYNGTKNGTFAYLTDTARYNVSTKFADTTYIETSSPCSNVRSASFWIKTDKTAYRVAWADAKSKLAFGIVTAGDILISCNGGYTKKYPNSVIAANVWQHIVIVRGEDIANTDLYVNGVKQSPGTSTDYWSHTSDTLIINGRGYSTPSRMNSQMSDFRLYATALSATQVAELYNTAISVANNGTLMGYELVEG